MDPRTAEAERRIAEVKSRPWQRSLDLSGLHLGEIPDSLKELRRLTDLSLSNNSLTDVPDFLGDFHHLTRLDLGRNELTVVPPALARLEQLRFLGLDGNRIARVPDWIGHLSELEFLSLGDNRLTELPPRLGNLRKLTALDLSGNDSLVSPPPEVLQGGWSAILAFLQASQGGSSPLWRSKILVVGEGQVGKTSLVKAISGIDHDPGEPTTHGMTVSELSLEHPHHSNVRMALSVWDFGGQDIYHATHQFFLTDRSLFLLVWSTRLGHEHSKVRYWLDIITARAPGAPILLVATHSDARPADLPWREIRRDYPRVVGTLAVDCDPRTGIGDLVRAVAREAADLPLMGMDWPDRWSEARDLLKATHTPHVTAARMREVMRSAGVIDLNEQAELALIFTQLGEILYYADDENLSDMVVVQPQWLNSHISRVLDSEAVARRGGLLTQRDVETEWADIDPHMRRHFIEMMDKYDISYRAEDPSREIVSVVVERLPWDPPDYQPQWDAIRTQARGSEIHIQYRLSVMPPGIPTWFIARSHRFATEMHWRTGALLQHPDGMHMALITADRDAKTVDLIVRGPMPSSFFGILDDGLNMTLDRYPGLGITRHIPCRCSGDASNRCGEYFEYGRLVRRLLKGKDNIACPETDFNVNIRALLLGVAPTKRDSDRAGTNPLTILTIMTQGAENPLNHTEHDQYQFMRLQSLIQRMQETRCPSVFTLTRDRRLSTYAEAYNLRLYCEEPGSWHPLPFLQGSYAIKEPNDWLRRFGSHLYRTLNLLSRATPITGWILGVAAHELQGRLHDDVVSMRELLRDAPRLLKLPDDPLRQITADPLPDNQPTAQAETDADFRVLEIMLTQLDPSRSWGGLSRIVTPEGQTLFVCRDHYGAYRSANPARRD